MKRYSICPFCFERINLYQVDFRCANIPEQCPPENDALLAQFLGVGSQKMNKVVKIPSPSTKIEKMWLPAPLEATCQVCHQKTTIRLCPNCHSELPSTVGEFEDIIFTIIGTKNAGKSHYLSVLITQIQHEISPHFDCTLHPLNDETVQRYLNDFYSPVFGNQKIIQVNGSEPAINSRRRLPLTYTLSFNQKGKVRDVITLVFFDTAGEELDYEDTNRIENKAIYQSSGLILLLDSLQLPAVRKQLPPHTILPSAQLLEKAVSGMRDEFEKHHLLERVALLIRQAHQKMSNYLIKSPIAIALSKMDVLSPLLDNNSIINSPSQHPGYFDIDVFNQVNSEIKYQVRDWAEDLIDVVEHNFQHYAFFGITALGCNPVMSQKIDSLKPRRVEEPFLWLLWKHHIISDQTFLGKLEFKLRPFKIPVFLIGVVTGLLISILLVTISREIFPPPFHYEPETAPMTQSSQPLKPTPKNPIEFVRAYYDDINNGDATSAIYKWKSQNKNLLRKLIEQAQWIKINQIALINQNSKVAYLSIDVDGKTKNQTAQERWIGTIKLEKINGEWKISNMSLSQVLGMMSGAGVVLRKKPDYSIKNNLTTQLQMGTIITLLEKMTKLNEQWYKIATPDGNQGWVPEKYTMPLDWNQREQIYIDFANEKLNSQPDFGTLVELCNFLSHISEQVASSEKAAELKLLHLVALQRSLEQIERDQQDLPRYSNWLNQQQSMIEYNDSTGSWVVKKELFEQL